jgi:hypothetical protein
VVNPNVVANVISLTDLVKTGIAALSGLAGATIGGSRELDRTPLRRPAMEHGLAGINKEVLC